MDGVVVSSTYMECNATGVSQWGPGAEPW